MRGREGKMFGDYARSEEQGDIISLILSRTRLLVRSIACSPF
jgi:hypothetical protein